MLERVGDCNSGESDFNSGEKPDKESSSESCGERAEVEGVGSGILGCIAQERFRGGWSFMTGLSSLSDSVADERTTVESEVCWGSGFWA